MYRVLIVDDEEMITDSLASMLEGTKRYELDVYKAYSGAEALLLLGKYQFDIVISDICMPGMNGISLAESIRQRWPLCHVIFQTGYDEFQYARQAIEQKVTHYILKSEGDEILLNAIGDCIRSIDCDADMQDTLSRAREEADLYRAILRRNLIQTQIYGQIRPTSHTERAFKKLNITLNLNQPVMLLAGHCSQELTDELFLAISLILQEKVSYAVRSEAAWMNRQTAIWVLQPPKQEAEAFRHAQAVIKGMAESVCRAITQTLAVSISFVFQEKPVFWDQLSQPFEELKYIASSLLRPDSSIALAGVEYFKGGDEGSDGQNEADLEKSFINRLMTYMTEHIDGDLSLCTLSEKLHLNPSYLSRRFKELTGKNLTEAILEIRMETACRLLRTTSFRISEIAQMVGYETAANFSRVFKKSMKVTPREFRDEEGIIQ